MGLLSGRRNTWDASDWYKEADRMIKKKRLQDAEQAFSEAFVRAKENTPLWRMTISKLVKCLMQMDRYDDAIEVAKLWSSSDDPHKDSLEPMIRRARGEWHEKRGELALALTEYFYGDAIYRWPEGLISKKDETFALIKKHSVENQPVLITSLPPIMITSLSYCLLNNRSTNYSVKTNGKTKIKALKMLTIAVTHNRSFELFGNVRKKPDFDSDYWKGSQEMKIDSMREGFYFLLNDIMRNSHDFDSGVRKHLEMFRDAYMRMSEQSKRFTIVTEDGKEIHSLESDPCFL